MPAPTCRASAPCAKRDGDDKYVVNGTKTWISNGVEGHCFALLVKTDPEVVPRHKGMSHASSRPRSTLRRARRSLGVKNGRKLEKLGYKSIDSGELVFDDYKMPRRQPDRWLASRRVRGFIMATSGLETWAD